MEILFNINSENLGELHNILGIVDADFKIIQYIT